MTVTRRDFLKHSGVGGIGLLTFSVAGCDRKMTPADARREGATYKVLQDNEVTSMEVIGETILPGSAELGLAHYVDHQLAASNADSMLMIKYLGVNPPFTDFYRSSLSAAKVASTNLFDLELAELTTVQANTLVEQMATEKIVDWQGPPSGFFYFVLRSDAVDVCYGTQKGYESLGIPYAAHIEPPSRWGE